MKTSTSLLYKEPLFTGEKIYAYIREVDGERFLIIDFLLQGSFILTQIDYAYFLLDNDSSVMALSQNVEIGRPSGRMWSGRGVYAVENDTWESLRNHDVKEIRIDMGSKSYRTFKIKNKHMDALKNLVKLIDP